MRLTHQLTLCFLLLFLVSPLAASAEVEEDLAAARILFEANLDAIRQRDREAYLACYLESEGLVRNGPTGIELGYEGLAAAAGNGWPDLFEAQDLRLTPIRPGLVYGSYRYRVRYGDREAAGLSERLFLETEDGWRIAVTTAFPAPPGTPPPPRALVGATLIDGTGAEPVTEAVVVMRDGKIDCAGPADQCPVPTGVEMVDLRGYWITPGIVDAHVHFSQTGWADGRPDSLDVRDRYPYEAVQAGLRTHPERYYRSYLCSGVTAVFDVGGYPWTWGLSDSVETQTEAPHVAASGPLLSTLDFWLNLPGEAQFIYLADEEAAREGVAYLAAQGADAVKVWFIAVDIDQREQMDAAVMAAGEEARNLGLPLIVHATGQREAKVALKAGAHLLVHSVWDEPVDQELIDLALANGTVYCPTLTVGSGYVRMFEAAVTGVAPVVDDPLGCVDKETLEKVAETADLGSIAETEGMTVTSVSAGATRTAQRDRIAAQNLARLHQAGVTIAMGTDAGNPLTLHGPSVYAEMEAMQAAGLTPTEVLVTATQGGATAMGRQDDLGTIEAGKIADLVLLEADPTTDIANMRQLRYVVRAGVLRSVDELRAAK
ncbi:MAG: amidohydrolase family protein [Thermoanaerobaculia bacterium]